MSARRAVALFLAAAAVLAAPPRAESWGFTAHRLVNRKAVSSLPEPLQSLFAANADYLAEHSIDPDLLRAAGQESEGPNHFLDLDAFGAYPFPGIPRIESEHLARNGKDALQKGRVPWRVAEVYRELVAAFRAKDSARALERAALLGHYVSDAHVPLHAVVNYDGKDTGQAGVHARWESGLVDRFERQLEAAVLPPPVVPVGDPVDASFGILLDSYTRSPAVLAADKAAAGPNDFAETPEDDRYDDAYYSRYFEREGAGLAARLSASVSAVASFWTQAWHDAGSPPLPAYRFPYVRRQVKGILVSLDGSSAPVLDDAVARGVMPNLARLRRAGATARGSITSLPSKTAAGHATLFTGAWPDRHGIAGNEIPLPGRPVTESVSGYPSTPLRAEPLWAAAARQGLQVSVVSATQVYPFDPYLGEKRFGGNYGRSLTLMDGYQAFAVPGAAYTAKDLTLRGSVGWNGPLPAHLSETRDFEITVAGTRVDGLLYDDPQDPVQGFDTVYLGLNKNPRGGITLKPKPASPEGPGAFSSLSLRAGGGELGVHFRLFALSPSASEILLYRAESSLIRSSKPLLEPAALKATGGFTGNGASRLYEAGGLGPTLWQGGDGNAEERYLETVRLSARQFERLFEFGFDHTRWDLLVAYLPYPDEALHAWLGYLDPALPDHDAALAARLRPYLDRVLGIVDGYLGHLTERAGSSTVLAVASDHGMIGANRSVQLNLALQKAGLLTLTPEGGVDLFRTQAVYFPGNSGYFLVNRVSRAQGVVKPEEEATVLAKLRAALGQIRDPDTGAAVVRRILDPRQEGRELGLGGPQGGDLYVALAPGYQPSAALRGELVSKRAPHGDHVLDPERREMQAAFTVSGPGVAAGADLGLIHQVDVAPTLSALLGLEPPAQAVGKVLREALAPRTPLATGQGQPAANTVN